MAEEPKEIAKVKEIEPTEREIERAQSKIETPPRSVDIVHSDSKTVRDLQLKLAEMEKKEQERSEELGSLRTIIDQLSRVQATGLKAKRKDSPSLLDSINEMIFGGEQNE